MSATQPPPVDIVITWVDGADPAHQKKRQHALEIQAISEQEAIAPTRFNQVGEIDFCLQSIFKFAPWFRKIYIITDNQIPTILDKLKNTSLGERISIVDHSVIYQGYEHYLPTFNSLSIEAMMWRIPDLSEHFIYFNDDCMLLRPVSIEDFFLNNKLVLRGHWKTQVNNQWAYVFPRFLSHLMPFLDRKIPQFRCQQENSAQLMGFKRQFFHLPHAPFPLKKSLFQKLYEQNVNFLTQQIDHKVRHAHQHIPVSLLVHQLLQSKRGYVIDSCKTSTMIHASAHSFHKIKNRLNKAQKLNHVTFLCVQSLDEGIPEVSAYIIRWLKQHLL